MNVDHNRQGHGDMIVTHPWTRPRWVGQRVSLRRVLRPHAISSHNVIGCRPLKGRGIDGSLHSLLGVSAPFTVHSWMNYSLMTFDLWEVGRSMSDSLVKSTSDLHHACWMWTNTQGRGYIHKQERQWLLNHTLRPRHALRLSVWRPVDSVGRPTSSL